MILLFGNKASNTSSAKKNTGIKNHPVENSGILAMNMNNMSMSQAKSLLTMGEYDTYEFTNAPAVNYAIYAGYTEDGENTGYVSAYSEALACMGIMSDGGFGGFDCGGFAGASCAASCGGSFASVC